MEDVIRHVSTSYTATHRSSLSAESTISVPCPLTVWHRYSSNRHSCTWPNPRANSPSMNALRDDSLKVCENITPTTASFLSSSESGMAKNLSYDPHSVSSNAV